MDTEFNETFGNYQIGYLDPFGEPRTIPGQWDVSALQSFHKPSPDGHLGSDSKLRGLTAGEDFTTVIVMESFAMEYLDPDFDPDSSPSNWCWLAY